MNINDVFVIWFATVIISCIFFFPIHNYLSRIADALETLASCVWKAPPE